jgi:hypothetical protein
VDSLALAERARIGIALRLALLEVLAPAQRLPLLVGPGASGASEDEDRVLARALARLSARTQVIQFCVAAGPFADHAGALHRLSA